MRISDWSSDVCSSDLLEARTARRFAQRNAVDADLDFDDVLDAVRGAAVELLLLDPARRGRDVGRVAADTGAETLEAAAGARAVDLRRLVPRRLGELFADRGEIGRASCRERECTYV